MRSGKSGFVPQSRRAGASPRGSHAKRCLGSSSMRILSAGSKRRIRQSCVERGSCQSKQASFVIPAPGLSKGVGRSRSGSPRAGDGMKPGWAKSPAPSHDGEDRNPAIRVRKIKAVRLYIVILLTATQKPPKPERPLFPSWGPWFPPRFPHWKRHRSALKRPVRCRWTELVNQQPAIQ